VRERQALSTEPDQSWLRGGSFLKKEHAKLKDGLQSLLKINTISGAANRIRTCDPVITNDVLYQLSYCGGPCGAFSKPLKTPAPDNGQRPALQQKRWPRGVIWSVFERSGCRFA
jgi:hypothetical protein